MLVIGCVVVAVASLFMINLGVPRPVEPFLSVLAAPLFIIFVPLYPMLDASGLMTGEYFRLPSKLGLVLATAAYALVAYGVAYGISRSRR